MPDYYNSIPLKRVTRTVANMLEAPAPEGAADGLDFVERKLKSILGGPAQRAVLYHADAIGMHLIQKYTQRFIPVLERGDVCVPMVSTVASVTPVAHATMYTGVDPQVHGILVYDRHKLTCQTLFDTLLAAGRHPAIIAMPDSTFLHIFAGREMPYYEVQNNAQALEKAEDLMSRGECDVISIHTFEYDDAAHEDGPESQSALAAASREAEGYAKIHALVQAYWNEFNVLTAYLPDHGQHAMEPFEPNPHGYKGDHGSFRGEDMNVLQYYSAIPAMEK